MNYESSNSQVTFAKAEQKQRKQIWTRHHSLANLKKRDQK